MDASIDRPAFSAYKHGRQASYHSLPRSELSDAWPLTGPWERELRDDEDHSRTAYPGGLATSFDDRAPQRSREFEMLPLVTHPGQDPSKIPNVSIGLSSPDTDFVREDLRGGGGIIPKLWTPFFLRRVVLIGFACVFAAMLVALEILFLFSNRNNGLSTTDSSKHYLWTYGPTAVLIILAGVWGQVEYRTKQLIPWKAMSQRPTPATKSLLVDYISPWNVLSMFAAMKASHHVVSITILGSLLIKLLTVVSTGLFMLQDVTLQSPHTNLIAQGKFDGSKFDSARVGGNAALTVAGLNLLNLSYPLGTTDQHAFQPFNMSKSIPGPGSTLAGIVDVFSADLECEEGKLSNWTSYCDSTGCEQTRTFLDVTTPSCPGYRFPAFMRSTGSGGGYFGDIYAAKCMNASPEQSPDRLVIVIAHWAKKEMVDFASLACKPTYSITQRLVSLNGDGSGASIAGDSPTAALASNNTLVPHVQPWDIVLALNSSLGSAARPIDSANKAFFYYPGTNSTYFGIFFQILNITAPHEKASDFLDVRLLQTVSRQAYASITAQIARQNLMSTSAEPFSGSYSASEHRLFVRELSLRLMEGTLVLLIIIAGAVHVFRPSQSMSRDPGSIGGLATILARSSKLTATLQGTGTARIRTIRNLLGYKLYNTMSSSQRGVPSFSVGPSLHSTVSESQLPLELDSASVRWWQPFSVTAVARVLVLGTPLALIAALEATYQHSHHVNGLATIVSEGYIRYTWVYLPALVMLLVRTLFDTIDFSAKIFQPYLELRRGGATAQGSIMENHLAKVTIHSFWSSLFKRQYAISATAFAMLLAPSLTIVVSGLYSAEDVNFERSLNIHRIDAFNTTIDPGSNSQAALVGSLIVNSNLPYPKWTYDELVFPTLQLQWNDSHSETVISDDVRIIKVRVPALRSALKCEPIPADHIYVSSISSSMVLFDANIGTDCGDSGYTGHTMDNQTVAISDLETGDYFGKIQNLAPAPQNTSCPALVALYGHFIGNSTSAIHGFTCNPYIQLLQANTTFLLPDFKIIAAVPDESSADTFALTEQVISQLTLTDYLLASNTTGQVFDPFFSALLTSKSLPLSALTDPNPNPSEQFPRIINATQHLHRLLMAQSINAVSRFPANQSSSGTIPATLIDPNRVRLKQSPISTRILEAFLAAMFLCAATAFSLMRTRDVLPKNPCSIAAGASLLAGARMLSPDVIPPGSEWCDDKELLRRGVFEEPAVFSLGWWNEGNGGRRFGVDVGRADAI